MKEKNHSKFFSQLTLNIIIIIIVLFNTHLVALSEDNNDIYYEWNEVNPTIDPGHLVHHSMVYNTSIQPC